MRGPDIRFIDLALIDVAANRLRPVDEAWAEAIAASMDASGQREVITVRPSPAMEGRYLLIVGGHRLRAAEIRGAVDILAAVEDVDDLQARLVEIDENLIRQELSALDRAIHLAERKRVFDEMHPEARHGGDRRSDKARSRDQVAKLATRFTAEAAARTGLSERAIRRAVALVRDLDADALAAIRKTHVADKEAQLRALSKLAPERQREAAAAIRDGRVRSVSAARGAAGKVSAEDQAFEILMKAWNRAGAKARRRFMAAAGLQATGAAS